MLNCTFAGRPGPCGPATTGITVTVARPGHDCDCAQAPARLVACRAAGVVTCSRLVVCTIRHRARGPMPVRLLATHAPIQKLLPIRTRLPHTATRRGLYTINVQIVVYHPILLVHHVI